jgi:CheY-like chemotaxis protein
MPGRRPLSSGLPDDRGWRDYAGPVPGPCDPMKRPSRSALIVSDSAPLRRYAAAALEAGGFVCAECASGLQAMDRFHQTRFSLYVIDLDMPPSDGLSMFAITLTGGDGERAPSIIGCTRSGRPPADGPWSDEDKFSILLPAPFRPQQLLEAAEAALETADQ